MVSKHHATSMLVFGRIARFHLVALSTNNNACLSTLLSRTDLNILRAPLCRWDSETISVTEEKNTLALTSSILRWLNPLTPPSGNPHALDKPKSTATSVRSVVFTHNWLDGLASLVSVVKGNDANVVVEDVGFDDAVH